MLLFFCPDFNCSMGTGAREPVLTMSFALENKMNNKFKQYFDENFGQHQICWCKSTQY